MEHEAEDRTEIKIDPSLIPEHVRHRIGAAGLDFYMSLIHTPGALERLAENEKTGRAGGKIELNACP